MALHGDLSGLSKVQRAQLEAFEEIKFPRQFWGEAEQLISLWTLAQSLEQDIALAVDRSGQILDLKVFGWDNPELYALHGARRRVGLSGVRFFRTRLEGNAALSDADRRALQTWRYDGFITLSNTPQGLTVTLATLGVRDGVLAEDLISQSAMDIESLEKRDFRGEILALEKQLDREQFYKTRDDQERAVLVFLLEKNAPEQIIVRELEALSETAGIEVVGVLTQTRRPRQMYLGAGKSRELQEMVQETTADVVIFDMALSPSYNRELEKLCGVKVIDKTALILDIFAQRARSREGKLQVELAQLTHLLPRLTGKGLSLSRLGGGVGTRGPGETQLESDRRHIRRRLNVLRKEIQDVMTDRSTQRAARLTSPEPRFALVGYTNAGKSSLLNALSKDTLYAEDQLFATLDPTIRRVVLPSGKGVLISDTVGFIRDLPPQLLDAFKATLEELKTADVLIHVVEVSLPGEEERMQVVDEILKELDVADKPRITVFNKIDLIGDLPVVCSASKPKDCIYLSSITGRGMASMWSMLERFADEDTDRGFYFIPFTSDQGRLLAQAHEEGQVEKLHYTEDGVSFEVTAPRTSTIWQLLSPYIERQQEENGTET